ncbi:methyl-accepting chemotaxis protein [Alkalihalobacillus oceani]|uniref:methyl-accepting chemotaxis protein n=1 Tax=Halalkalibacter oceani TaxID=1653776 RepID=UPI00203D02F3|nr:methyl-accepting chemotaxis protein [Halalkalibacter oceani]MCM3761991.1 methyl-accepting chemotaxis protein [Halalkalibacter oceani]
MVKGKSIKFKLNFFMIVLLVIPLVFVALFLYQKTAILEKAIIQKEDLESMSSAIEATFLEYEEELKYIAELPEIQYEAVEASGSADYQNMPAANEPALTAFYEAYLQELSRDDDYLINLYLGTNTGALYLDQIPPEEVDLTSYDPRTTAWYTQAEAAGGEVIWTDPYFDTATGKSTITLATTVESEQGAVIGVVGMDFEMSKLATELRNEILGATILTAVISVIIGLVCVVLFVKGLVKNVQIMNEEMNRVAQGDLSTEPIVLKTNDEFSGLARSVNVMKDSLHHIVHEMSGASRHVTEQSHELTESANEVKEGSEQIAATMQQLSSGTETQANRAADLAEFMERFTNEIEHAYQNGEEIAAVSKGMLKVTEEGSQLMTASVTQMNNINQIVHKAVEKVRGLDQQSQEISALVEVIREVAERTNLLALNAAIEAARAGEHGKGFAVVADEVRKLSEQVNDSVGDITDIVTKIQSESNDVAVSLEDGYKVVDEGSHQIAVTGETFKQINQSVSDIVSKIKLISNNLKDISRDSEEMVGAVDDIASVSEELAAGVEQAAASAEQSSHSIEEVSNRAGELAQLAEQLKERIDHFKL